MIPAVRRALRALLRCSDVSDLDGADRAALTRAGYSTGGRDPELTDDGRAALAELRATPSEPTAWTEIEGREWACDGHAMFRRDASRPLERGQDWYLLTPTRAIAAIRGHLLTRGEAHARTDLVTWHAEGFTFEFHAEHDPLLSGADEVRWYGGPLVHCYDAAGEVIAVVTYRRRLGC